MAEKNIQIKIKNELGEYDNIFPKTKEELVEGLPTTLATKVDVVAGKGLSTEDFTTAEKTKLTGIEVSANNYVHPASHPASIITQDASNRFVSDAEKTTWNGKENASNKGQAGGYASLDSNAKVPLAQLPDATKGQTYVVANSTERNAITGMLTGDKAFETSTGNSYIFDGTAWQVLAQANWENVNLDWGNITNAPVSSPANIDDAVAKRHAHSNQTALNKITDTGTAPSYDLGKFVTQDDLGSAGYGDMLKSTYDTNNNGKVDAAEVADSVPWTGVTGKPSTFEPSAHTHPSSHITESTTQRFVSDTEKSTWNGKSKLVVSATTPATDTDVWFQEV